MKSFWQRIIVDFSFAKGLDFASLEIIFVLIDTSEELTQLCPGRIEQCVTEVQVSVKEISKEEKESCEIRKVGS